MDAIQWTLDNAAIVNLVLTITLISGGAEIWRKLENIEEKIDRKST